MAFAAGGNLGDVQRAVARGEPRPFELPNPWLWILPLVPGLDSIRSPAALFSGVHLALSALAGLGAAALLRLAPARWRTPLGALLVALVFVDTLRPPLPGVSARIRYEPLELRPSEASLDFFEALARKGDDGPLFEAWPDTGVGTSAALGRAVLLAAYHRRPTSACFGSFWTREQKDLWALGPRLHEPEALRRIRTLGFATIVLHHPPLGTASQGVRRALDRHAATIREPKLVKLHRDERRTAYTWAEDAP
jgi:hypothetical protein